MPLDKFCPRHPTRQTLYSCRRCSRPMCDHCDAESGGRFCSKTCAEEFKEFQSNVQDGFRVKRTRFSLLGCLRTAVISVVLIVVIWAALWQLTGTSDPGQMLSELGKMLRLMF